MSTGAWVLSSASVPSPAPPRVNFGDRLVIELWLITMHARRRRAGRLVEDDVDPVAAVDDVDVDRAAVAGVGQLGSRPLDGEHVGGH